MIPTFNRSHVCCHSGVISLVHSLPFVLTLITFNFFNFWHDAFSLVSYPVFHPPPHLLLFPHFTSLPDLYFWTLAPVWTMISSLTHLWPYGDQPSVINSKLLRPEHRRSPADKQHLHSRFRSKSTPPWSRWGFAPLLRRADGRISQRAPADIRHIYRLSEHIRARGYKSSPRAPLLMLTVLIPCCLSRDPCWTPFILPLLLPPGNLG